MTAAAHHPDMHRGRGMALPFAFVLLLLFIQEGFSYYASAQIMALLFVAGFVLHSGVTLRITPILLVVLALFAAGLLVTAYLSPTTISQNSPNIVVTVVGVLGYVVLMLAMISLRPRQGGDLLLFYKRSSALAIVLMVLLVALTELAVIPHLTREFFILQNIGLVTNYSDMGIVVKDLLARGRRNVEPDIDLLYGEPSFLSLVMFVCLVSYLISSSALARGAPSSSADPDGGRARVQSLLLLFAGLACMLYIQSFSSLFYVVILGAALLAQVLVRPSSWGRPSPLKVAGLVVLIAAIGVVVLQSFPYYLHRLTTFSDSLSAQQRFGIILNFLPQDFLLGLHDSSRMPPHGFHNGVIYVVMLAGAGGVGLLAYLLYQVMRMARPLGFAVLSALAVLAVFSQNGAIFSPNKLVILSLIFLPLSSMHSVVQE